VILASLILLGSAQLSNAEFSAKIEKLAMETSGPGTSAIVIQDGRPVFLRAHGLADTAKQKKFTTNTAFEIGSISKQFVGTAILMLVKDKKLSLSDKLYQHLPEIPEAWRGASIQQTLHHMSGIPDYEEIAGYDFYNGARSEASIISEASKKEPEFKPGDRFQYSNTGYFLLSMIVSRRSGMPVGQFLESKIFKPLGMTGTYASTVPPIPSAATGYHRRTGELKAQPPIAWSSTLGAGGIVSTLGDIAVWDASLYTEKLLPDHLRNLLWSTATANDGTRINYGFGWISDSYRDIPRQNHSGQTNGFTCYYFRFPSRRTSVFAVTNTYGGRVGAVANALAAHFVAGASMHSLAPIPGVDESERQTHLKMLRQAVLAEGDDLISPGIKDFATKDEFKGLRDPLQPLFADVRAFERVKEKKVNDTTVEYTYRLTSKSTITFFIFRVIGGKMTFLSFGDE